VPVLILLGVAATAVFALPVARWCHTLVEQCYHTRKVLIHYNMARAFKAWGKISFAVSLSIV